jgi:SAM-dependent methyltransferase
MAMASGRHADAWTEFWQEQDVKSSCCDQAPDIRSRLDHHWRAIAASLPLWTKVLDVGCGAGAVGHALVAANPSLRVTGVDFAAVPVAGDGRIDIMPHTPMECLPFGDGSFGAAVSQFGFEYGCIKDASRELARVLRPRASFSFLVHHSKGRIVVDSPHHRQALEAICGPRLESAFLTGNAAALDRQLLRIRRQCPCERIVDQAAQGLRRHIRLPEPSRVEIWRAVKAALAPELVMLAELEASSVSPDRLESWLQPLAERFELNPPDILWMQGGGPLCWKFEGVRKA